jgi:hypothetical protein
MRLMLPMAMKKHMTHITNQLIMRMLPMDMTHMTVQVIMRLMLPMVMKKHMAHITNRVIMKVRITMTRITKQVITDVIGTVIFTQCCKSHVGSKQNINIMHKNICTETL